MKKIFLAFTIFVGLATSQSLQAQKTKSRIDLIEDREASNVELRHRIRVLQETVLDLDDRVTRLEAKVGIAGGTTSLEAQKITCYIETPFDGLFDATDVNETKARVEAVKACMNKVKSRIHCSADKVKCGK